MDTVGREVDGQILHAAESHVRRLLFPHSDLTSSLFSIVDLHEAWQAVVSTCPPPPHPPLFAKCNQGTRRGWRRRKVTRQFPVVQFSHRQASKRKLPGYIDRISRGWFRGTPFRSPLQGGLKGLGARGGGGRRSEGRRGLHLRKASRGLEVGFKGASRGLQGGLKGA